MRYSLPSRDQIADCIETMHAGYSADAMLTLAGCDKTNAGVLMPIFRADAVGITLYGGTGRSGRWMGKSLDAEGKELGCGGQSCTSTGLVHAMLVRPRRSQRREAEPGDTL